MLFLVRRIGFESPRDWERFEAELGKNSAREISAYFILDFNNGKDRDAIPAASDRLMPDLKSKCGVTEAHDRARSLPCQN
jgi:hypothetical protein